MHRARKLSLPRAGLSHTALACALAVAGAMGCEPTYDPGSVPAPVIFPEAFVVLHQEVTSPPLEANESGDVFGSAIAVGDFNCDGYDDLAVSMPGEAVDLGGGLEPDVGAVAVFLYNPALPVEMPYDAGPVLFRSDIDTIGDPKSGDRFGHALAAAPIDRTEVELTISPWQRQATTSAKPMRRASCS